jgi:DNA-binding FrmR family transcriptional regulator
VAVEGTHTHIAPDGTVYEHTHEHTHEHSHEEMHEHDHDHEHVHGEEHTHDHEAGHAHGHTHTHANTKAVLNRLSRAIGHLESIKRMVEEGRDCSEVLVQLSAVKSAINNTGKVILKDHIEHCLVDAVECGDMEAIADLTDAIDRFMK